MRTNGHPRLLTAALVAAAVVVGAASWAFACTPGGEMFINPAAGRAGSQATVTGTGWGANEPAVEVRWNSMSGPVLGRATPLGGSFSVNVTIPQAPPGVYYIVATSPTRGTPGRVAFEVTAVPASMPTNTNGETQTSGSADANESATSSGAGNTTANSGADSESATSSPSSQSFGPVAGSAAAQPASETASAPSRAAASATASSATAAGSTARSARVAAPASSSAAATPSEGPSPAPLPADSAPPSARSAFDDLASGFEPGPSLVPGLDDTTSSTAPHSPLALGVGLLAGGLSMLFAGFAAAELRRRRSTVSS